MSRVAQMLNRRLALLGVPGIAGLGVIMACLAFYDAGIRPLQRQLQQRQQMLDERAHTPVKAMQKNDWQTLQAHLPPQAQADELAANIYRMAEAAQINLREAEYKEEKLDKARILARHLNFSARGDYFQVRRFLSDVLSEIPSLALDAVSFQKSRDGGNLLEVRIVLTLYVAP